MPHQPTSFSLPTLSPVTLKRAPCADRVCPGIHSLPRNTTHPASSHQDVKLPTHTGRGPYTHKSPWFRALAIFCILLVGVGSTAQACHAHDSLPTSAKNSRNGIPAAAPDHCPLCAAMHSALPSSVQGQPVRIQSVQALLPTATRPRSTRPTAFELFSRPPPAASPRTPADGRQAGTRRFIRSMKSMRSMQSPEV